MVYIVFSILTTLIPSFHFGYRGKTLYAATGRHFPAKEPKIKFRIKIEIQKFAACGKVTTNGV